MLGGAELLPGLSMCSGDELQDSTTFPPSQNMRTNLQGKSEAVFVVFYAAHEKEAEGLSCEDMALLHNFLKRAERALNFSVTLCDEAQIPLPSSGDRC